MKYENSLAWPVSFDETARERGSERERKRERPPKRESVSCVCVSSSLGEGEGEEREGGWRGREGECVCLCVCACVCVRVTRESLIDDLPRQSAQTSPRTKNSHLGSIYTCCISRIAHISRISRLWGLSGVQLLAEVVQDGSETGSPFRGTLSGPLSVHLSNSAPHFLKTMKNAHAHTHTKTQTNTNHTYPKEPKEHRKHTYTTKHTHTTDKEKHKQRPKPQAPPCLSEGGTVYERRVCSHEIMR